MRENTILNIILASVATNAVASVAAVAQAHSKRSSTHSSTSKPKINNLSRPNERNLRRNEMEIFKLRPCQFFIRHYRQRPKKTAICITTSCIYFKKATEPNPQLALTLQLYKDICKLFGSNPHTV